MFSVARIFCRICSCANCESGFKQHVEQQSHGRTTHAYTAESYLTILKIVHRCCEYTKRCKTWVLISVRSIAKIKIAFSRVWVVCMSAILRKLHATTKTHAMNAGARATYSIVHGSKDILIIKCCKVPLLKGALDYYDIFWITYTSYLVQFRS